jgi:hypothetical protein
VAEVKATVRVLLLVAEILKVPDPIVLFDRDPKVIVWV